VARVLVTLEPRMYRQAIALALQSARPHSEVMLVPEESLDGQVHEFAPHVLVRGDFGQKIPEELSGMRGSLVCRVEVLYTDHMGVRVSVVGGRSYTIEDATMDNLISIVDETERLISG
jgi:hypothetical protein